MLSIIIAFAIGFATSWFIGWIDDVRKEKKPTVSTHDYYKRF